MLRCLLVMKSLNHNRIAKITYLKELSEDSCFQQQEELFMVSKNRRLYFRTLESQTLEI